MNLNKDENIAIAPGGTGKIKGNVVPPDPTAYTGATGSKAIDPSVGNATLTKGTAGTDYTLAAPGAANVGKTLRITTTTAAAHVVIATGLLGGTTLTFAAAIGNGVVLYAVSATMWRIDSNVGVTQS